MGKFLGSVLILIGTAIGAGMLALPLVSATSGFVWSLILLVVIWLLSIITGLMTVEANLALPATACSFGSMARQILGPFWQIVTWLAYLLLLYSATAAYIAGISSLLTTNLNSLAHINIPNWINALTFTVVLGAAVYWSTSAVDYCNRGLISIKGLLLVVSLSLMLPHINVTQLLATTTLKQAGYLWAAVPIFVCAFCYHIVMPSLRIYLDSNVRNLKLIIFYGSTSALIIYIIWLTAVFGTVPLTGEKSFASLAAAHGSVGEFINLITVLVNNKWVTLFIDGFANIAMATSFLGVTLSLFDFLADGFKRTDTRWGRLQTALLTFIPPLVFALCYPKGFIMALEYTAIFVAILSTLLPALMVYKMRQNKALKSPYRFFGNNIILLTTIVIGVIFVILPIIVNLR